LQLQHVDGKEEKKIVFSQVEKKTKKRKMMVSEMVIETRKRPSH
jgi:hypothetical protein